MSKRILITFLWFNVGWVAGSMATFFVGMPAGLDVGLALVLGGVVWFDPMHQLWTVRRTVAARRTTDHFARQRMATE
jgi:hypothetical protein